ncbi:MAG TPA: FAD-dependent monooxygenase [Methylophilaceae bacterium]|nr:FAD-dependent monooxygenase [Methylophilaceae bacterium]
MRSDFDAVIIGGGPAGATAAILLAEGGWSVALVEKQAFPRRKVCGECIAAPNLPLLERLGIAESFERLAGAELRQVGLMLGKRTVTAALPALQKGAYPWGRALGREHLDSLLLDRARLVGVHVMQPWTVSAVEGSPGDFACSITSAGTGESVSLTSPVVVAASGSWGNQPFLPGPKPPHKPNDLLGFKANFRRANLRPGLLPVLAFPGGYGGMVRAGDDLLTVACCIRRDALQDCRQKFPRASAGESVEAYLRAACLGVEQTLRPAERQGAWLSAGPLRPGIRVSQSGNGPLLVGNAAGEAHPIIGEGISMAMQSAWLLSRRLLQQGKPDVRGFAALRKDYAREWRRQFAPRLRLAAAFAHLAMRPQCSGLLLPFIEQWPGLLTCGAYYSGKVSNSAMP